MYLYTASEWLNWIASLSNGEIYLGLDRVKIVANRLNLLSPACSVIIVGGTNGKGSSVAGLEAIYLRAGYTVGAFTSPFLFKYNEQVRINGNSAADELFCHAFAKVAERSSDIVLTPFEFHTLAALLIFKEFSLDVLILEVGLGGRLDAVNIIEPDLSIVTSIALDHMNWLGESREKIAIEKAGIFRANKPAICGDLEPPETLLQMATDLKAQLYCQGKDFFYKTHETTWSWYHDNKEYNNLPMPSLALQNMSTVLMAVELMQNKLPVDRQAIGEGLTNLKLPGRVQIIFGAIVKIFDVAHNPAAMAYLAKRLAEMECSGKTLAVFSMLADKDIAESIRSIREQIDAWFAAPLSCKRAASLDRLKDVFQSANIQQINFCNSIQEAYSKAETMAQPGDRIVVFGSFHTVSEAIPHTDLT